VVGDVSGFAAASYLRGIRFVQIPTTLLAMIDSSVGGKTGVNLSQGKNLVGAFKQPSFVLIDPNTLKTLPEVEIRAGLAEVIKHGVIADPALFEILERSNGNVSMFWQSDCGASMIAKAVQVKIAFVEEDPYEQGIRACLNLGHTIGHALERVSHYKLRHGEAVAIGMIAAAILSSKMKISKSNITERLQSILHFWKLPVNCPPYPVEEILHAMTYDKKKKGGKNHWVLPESVGKVDIFNHVPLEIVRTTLLEMGAK
jgi:3-dehydroquinate synthase